MKMLAKVYGMKRSRGVMRDSGKTYDFTKVYLGIPLSDASGNMRGIATQEYRYGDFDNYEKFDGMNLPFDAEIELETVTDGNKVSQQILNITPLKSAAPAPVK